MAMNSLTARQLQPMRFEERLDHYAKEILLKGMGRPWQLYAAHAAIIATNYFGFLALIRCDLVRLLWGRCSGPTDAHCKDDKEREWQARRSLASLLFAKFLVWQHLAESLSCRQGPMGGHLGLPSNWKFRLSLGTIKYAMFPFLGKKRNIFDLLVHVLFYASGVAFLKSKEYNLKCIRTLCACDVWIFFSDTLQFFASTGNAYFSMLLSACFPESSGRLAGIQTALLMQWFFSGVGKIGPWFAYVNAPFMLQSKIFAGQRWLFDLLIRSPTDLSPTTFGSIFAHTAAAVEYLAPIALMIPRKIFRKAPSPEGTTLAESPAPPQEKAEVSILDRFATGANWFGLLGITGMHAYILTMPAPGDVYSWNLCFGVSAVYLFYYQCFGFDHNSAKRMHPGLAAFLLGEFALCWCGQFFPDRVGYLLSHRYWAGNWVQTFFWAKDTDAVKAKLQLVSPFSNRPQVWRSLKPLLATNGIAGLAYLWLGTLNVKPYLGLTIAGMQAARAAAGPGAEHAKYFPCGLPFACTGEFRDTLYSASLLPAIQEIAGFEAGECFMVHIGAFGLFRDTAKWAIYDVKEGLLKSGLLKLSALSKMHSLPSQSIGAIGDIM